MGTGAEEIQACLQEPRKGRGVQAVYRWFDEAVKYPGGRLLVRLGLTGNQVTLAGLAISGLAAVVIALTGQFWLGGLLFLLGASADLFDGAVARLRGTDRTSRLGGWLDTFADKLGEAALLLGVTFALPDVNDVRLAAAVALSSLLVGFAKAAAGEYYIRPQWLEVKLFGRPGRVMLLSAGLLLSGVPGLDPLAVVRIMLWVMLLGFNVPVLLQRVSKILVHAQSEEAARDVGLGQQAPTAEDGHEQRR
jgi:CDP-diacylglycerol--glycerol-3-phosphate 3-phosphatidyltransferase